MKIRPDVAKAAPLASTFDLEAIHFAAIEGRALPTGSGELGTAVLDWKLAPVSILWTREGNEVRALLPYQITITTDERPAFAIHVALRVDYALRAGKQMPSDDELDHFVGIMSFMHSWPYVRGEVQQLTLKLELPGLTLPVMVSGHVPDRVLVGRASERKPSAKESKEKQRTPARRKTKTA